MRVCLRLLPLLLLSAPFVRAAEWLHLTTPQFELFTDAGEQVGRDAIAHFEQVRSFFLQASPVRPRDENPLRIVIFRDREEFRPFAPNNQVIAYFTSDDRRDYIIMADGSPESYPVAIHEYAHLIIRHSGLRVPVWLNEGWAEVYSSLKPVKDGVAVGDLLPGRVKMLEEGKWLTLESLGSVTTTSAIYNEADRAGIFYAESWALAHMLFLSPDYKEGFAPLLANLHRGKNLTEALEIAYKRSPDQVLDDLQKYLSRKKLYGAVFKTTADRTKNPISVAPAPADAVKLVLAELHSSLGHLLQVEPMLEELLASRPNDPEIEEASGYVELRKQSIAGAQSYFQQAFDHGATDPKMCLLLAAFNQQTQQPPDKVIAPLERALKLKPDYVEAQVQLGLMRVATRDFPAALSTLSKIKSIKPELAAAVFSGLAYSALQTGDVESSRGYLETARKWARSGKEKQGVDQLAGFIDARARSRVPPKPGELVRRAEGSITNVACTQQQNAVQMFVQGRPLELLLPEPVAVEFSHPGGGTLQLTCGPQKPFLAVVEYVVSAEGLGIVRRIEY